MAHTEINDGTRQLIGKLRAGRAAISDIADELGVSAILVRSLLDDETVLAAEADETERIHRIVSRERTLLLMKTGEARRTITDIMVDDAAKDSDRLNAAKWAWENTVGPPVQRVHNLNESIHSIQPEQFTDLVDALKGANEKIVPGVRVDEDDLVTGKDATPDARQIAEMSVEGQTRGNGSGS